MSDPQNITCYAPQIKVYSLSQQTVVHTIGCSIAAGECPNGGTHCELWGPSFHPCGDEVSTASMSMALHETLFVCSQVSFTARKCTNHPDYDEIWTADLTDPPALTQVTNNNVPDFYSHFMRDGELFWSRKEGDPAKDNLCAKTDGGSEQC